jgi:hypothetical protein
MKAFIWAQLVVVVSVKTNSAVEDNLLRKWYGKKYVKANDHIRRTVEANSDKLIEGVEFMEDLMNASEAGGWMSVLPKRDKKHEAEDLSELLVDAQFPHESSFVEQASQNAVQTEGWHRCATRDGTCNCAGGRVRYGRNITHGQQLWTVPVELGSDTSVQCSLAALRAKRVFLPDSARSSDAPLQCQCAKREVYFKFHYSSSSLLEDIRADPIGTAADPLANLANTEDAVEVAMTNAEYATQHAPPVPAVDPGAWCLYVPQPGANNSATTTAAAAGSDLEAVRQFLGMELAVHVNIRACQEDEWEVWTFLESTGQLRHDRTGKCLTAHFDQTPPTLHANDCVNVESPAIGQMWRLPAYSSGPGTGSAGQMDGEIMLDYGFPGHHGLIEDANRYCLTAAQWEIPRLETCGVAPPHFTLQRVRGHSFHECSAESSNDGTTQTCRCPSSSNLNDGILNGASHGVGEIRIGDADVGESGFTQGVPARSVAHHNIEADPVVCNLETLQGLALPDPVIVEPPEDPTFRECQCSCADCQSNEAVARDLLGTESSGQLRISASSVFCVSPPKRLSE